MAATHNAYSRFVYWMKVLLPLTALAILSTLFFVAESLDPDRAIPFADVDVEQILQDQGISNPRFGGVTADGSEVSLWASAIRPEPDSRSRLIGSGLSARIVMPGEARFDVSSPEGVVDVSERTISLTEGVFLTSSLGYSISTDTIVANYRELRLDALGEVSATGPGGEIVAGRMSLGQDAAEGGYVLVFTDGVRLIYDPKQ